MTRVLIVLLCLVLPILVYLLWMSFEQKRNLALVRGATKGWATLPWAWLILSSIALIILSFLSLWFFDLDPDGWIGGPSLIDRTQENR